MSARGSLTIGQVLTLLEETPAHIAALTEGLTATQLHTSPERDEWSVNDVMAHLRSCADARGEFTRAILAEDRPTLRAIDQRARLLTFLKSLPEESWSRTAIVTGGGPARERTVLFYAQWLARHERAHVKHIGRTVNTMRGERRPLRGSDRRE